MNAKLQQTRLIFLVKPFGFPLPPSPVDFFRAGFALPPSPVLFRFRGARGPGLPPAATTHDEIGTPGEVLFCLSAAL